MYDNLFDTIVVGGGIAGLTATAYLAKAGQKVILFEKNRECGGLVNSFTRNGFHFDAGVRALENAGIIFPMLKDLNIHLDVVRSPVSVGIENEILHIESISSLSGYRDLLIRLFPESKGEIDKVLKTIPKIMKKMDVLYGIENPVFKDLRRDKAFLFKKLLPWLPKFILTVGKINRMNMPVEEYLDSIIQNPSLKDMISQHFFKNTPAFFALSYFSLYLDYFYPKGGVGKLSESIVKRISEYNGMIKSETRITKVLPGKNLVIDQNSLGYEYKNLIWAADLKTFYTITETNELSSDIRLKFTETKKFQVLS